MTEAMPFLQKTILLSYDPRAFAAGAFNVNYAVRPFGFGVIRPPFAEIMRLCAYAPQSTLSSPQKNSATVPGPVWLPIVVPTLFISTLPLRCGNAASTWSAT